MRPPLRRPVSPSHVAPQSPSVGSEKADGVPHAKAYVFADFARSRRWSIRWSAWSTSRFARRWGRKVARPFGYAEFSATV